MWTKRSRVRQGGTQNSLRAYHPRLAEKAVSCGKRENRGPITDHLRIHAMAVDYLFRPLSNN
jgi:hypothetical protein